MLSNKGPSIDPWDRVDRVHFWIYFKPQLVDDDDDELFLWYGWRTKGI